MVASLCSAVLIVASLMALVGPAEAAQEAAREGPETASVDTLKLTITEAVDRALLANEEARIARAAVDRTRGQVREAFALGLPAIDGSYRLTRNLQRPVLFFNQGGETLQISLGNENEHAFDLSMEQALFDRSLGAAVSAARHGNAASESDYERALTNVALRAREAYYEVLFARSRVDVRQGAIEIIAQRLEQVRLFQEVGTASDFDLLTAQVDLENEQPELIRAQNALRLAENGLKRVVGIPLDTAIETADTLAYLPVEIPLDEATARALTYRSDLEAQDQTVRLNEELVNVHRAGAYPTLSLRLDLTRRSSSDRFVPEDRDFTQSASAAVSLNFPIFDGRRTEGRELQARADLVASIEVLRALENDVRLEVLDFWQSVHAAAEAVEATRSARQLAREAHDVAMIRFRNGLSTQLELDEAEQDLIEARSIEAEAIYSHMRARARLYHAMGER